MAAFVWKHFVADPSIGEFDSSKDDLLIEDHFGVMVKQGSVKSKIKGIL